MPWSMNNPPPPAKNWPAEKKRRCISAGNRALAEGKSEEEAIKACIGAASTVKQKVRNRISQARVDLYVEEEERARSVMEGYAKDHLSGILNLSAFRTRMREEIKRFFIRAALIAKGEQEFTERDRRDLARFLAMNYDYLDGFIADLEVYNSKELATDQGVIHRAGTYGYGWGAFSRFTIPGELADMLPHMPGLSCLGGEKCGCILEWEATKDGYDVYWYVNPFKQHCVICADLAVEWNPYHISREEIIEEYGEFVEF